MAFSMRRVRSGPAALLVCFGAVVAAGAPAPAAQSPAPASVCNLQTTERIVAVGDIHGALSRVTAILTEAKLIDNRRRWIGGRAVLVQTGDILDRGAESRAVLDLLRKLEGEAARAGGRVHVLLGNHEVMRLVQYLRDVSPGEYAAFRTYESAALRDSVYTAFAAQQRDKARAAGQAFDERAFREQFQAETPLGFLEMRVAFAPTGDYGRWLMDRPTMIKINSVAFVHGGIAPAIAPQGCEAINTAAQAELRAAKPGDVAMLEKTLIGGATGPLWYRGYFVEPKVTTAEMDAILAALGAKTLVVGHTVAADHRILGQYDNRVFQIDTGMLGGEFYPGGVASALEIQGETMTAIYEGGRREVLRGATLTGR
jgi:hypothetical protein